MTPIRVASTTAVATGAEDANIGDLPVAWSAEGHRSVWRPSDAERVQIATGANVEILVMAQHVHPLRVEITAEQQVDEVARALALAEVN